MKIQIKVIFEPKNKKEIQDLLSKIKILNDISLKEVLITPLIELK